MGQPCTYFHFWVDYPFKSSTLHCGTERISAVSFLNTTHLSWLHKQKCTHFESSSASLLASSTSFPLKMNWECAPYITGPFPRHMCTPWLREFVCRGWWNTPGSMICAQWGNSLFRSVFIQQGFERVPGTLVLLSLWSDTDDSLLTLFWGGPLPLIHSCTCLPCWQSFTGLSPSTPPPDSVAFYAT